MKQPRLHSLRLTAKVQKFTAAIVICLTVFSPPTYAKHSQSEISGNKAVIAAMATIMQINAAMESAAQNPMDQWRRQNVAHAMGLLPLAIQALASEFKQSNLGDSDLPAVQAMLGGFIDTSAPGRFKQFLKTPDKSLIPQLGKGMSRGGSGSG